MKIQLSEVAKGPRNAALPPTTVAFESGQATLARAETEQRPSVLGLIASGRMRPDSGTVTIDGRQDYGAIRRRIALIDAPDVCEPAGDVTLAGVVAEELMFAGRLSHPIAVGRTLDSLGMSEWARYAISTVPPAVRIRALSELAVLRPGVEGVVLTSPDRHGGDPAGWWALAEELAERGYAVLAIAGDASAAALAAAAVSQAGTASQAAAVTASTAPDVAGPTGARPGSTISAATGGFADSAGSADGAEPSTVTEPDTALPLERTPAKANEQRPAQEDGQARTNERAQRSDDAPLDENALASDDRPLSDNAPLSDSPPASDDAPGSEDDA